LQVIILFQTQVLSIYTYEIGCLSPKSYKNENVGYNVIKPPTFKNNDENSNIQHFLTESKVKGDDPNFDSFMILFDKYSKLDSQVSQMKEEMLHMQKRMSKYESQLDKSPRSISKISCTKGFGLQSKHTL
jgi:hypothetical protein